MAATSRRVPTLQSTARGLLLVAFTAGGLTHLIWGRQHTDPYRAFGQTAWPPLDTLWRDFVVPHLSWLVPATGVFELACALGLVWGGKATQAAGAALCCFFGFLLVLGYAFPTTSWGEDLLKNRAGSLALFALALPIARTARHRPWRAVSR